MYLILIALIVTATLILNSVIRRQSALIAELYVAAECARIMYCHLSGNDPDTTVITSWDVALDDITTNL